MLRVKRASAGSGKTYELAKTFIKLLITSRRKGYRRQLKKDGSFRESLSSILAVTFTVKATAEMKQRIVDKLADLAIADEVSPEKLKKIDYLKEFIEDFETDKFEIAELARNALRTLLLHYSDFKVQTVDSFFQSILHTFAYEANLDDSFNTEINSDFITSEGFDDALEELSGSEKGEEAEETLHWLRLMMDNDSVSTKWNVFTRDDGKKSLYSRLIMEARNLEKEEYQKIKEELSSYFNHLERPFAEIVKDVDEANFFQPLKKLHEKRREKAIELKKELQRCGLDESHLSNYNAGPLRDSLEELSIDNFIPPSKEINGRKSGEAYALSGAAEKLLKSHVASMGDLNSTIVNDINSAFEEWREAANLYFREFSERKEQIMTWLAYRELIAKFMLVMEIARRKDSYLKATNSLQISDTSQILSRIIGDDDAPFIYERMGTRLSHFLIDEFQDTSGLQWQNLKPLIDESEANENENLIIGDAKQSIYRFRNANHSLITGLEKEFHNIVYYTQEKEPKDKAPQNTNFRSKPCIVEFNNYVFDNIVNIQNPKSGTPIFSDSIKEVYRDCIQNIKAETDEKNPRGYVEMVFHPKAGVSENLDEESDSDFGLGYSVLPRLILELRSRGYRFRDIGILVKSHEQGGKAMAVISEYNEKNIEDPIPVISEENLLVSSSLAVKIIIHALELAAGFSKTRMDKSAVLPDPVDEEELFSLLKSLNSLSIASIVEAVTGRFVPASRRDAEAPFIAAFQDAAIEYSSSKPSDIGSFLKWWRQKSKTLSIVSPEGSDGVTVQTIHKAKGLEYKCVIIPEANFSFDPGKFTEWRWVMTEGNVASSELLPPRLPVLTEKRLLETAHSAELEKYYEEYSLDELNKMYVGFTRAVSELYIFLPTGKKSTYKKASGALKGLFDPEERSYTESGLLSMPVEIDGLEDKMTVKYGMPSTQAQIMGEIMEENRKMSSSENIKIIPLNIYSNIVSVATEKSEKTEDMDKLGPTALFKNDNPLKTIVYPDGSEEEIDSRAEGLLKHRVMQMINYPEDLDKALLKLRVEGMISTEQLEKWRIQLSDAIESVTSRGWFAKEMRVFNERPLLAGDNTVLRPDRFVVTPDKDVFLIDYKFGDREEKYKKQIKGYKNLLMETGKFRSVKAYIWYVAEGEIVEI